MTAPCLHLGTLDLRDGRRCIHCTTVAYYNALADDEPDVSWQPSRHRTPITRPWWTADIDTLWCSLLVALSAVWLVAAVLIGQSR